MKTSKVTEINETSHIRSLRLSAVVKTDKVGHFLITSLCLGLEILLDHTPLGNGFILPTLLNSVVFLILPTYIWICITNLWLSWQCLCECYSSYKKKEKNFLEPDNSTHSFRGKSKFNFLSIIWPEPEKTILILFNAINTLNKTWAYRCGNNSEVLKPFVHLTLKLPTSVVCFHKLT